MKSFNEVGNEVRSKEPLIDEVVSWCWILDSTLSSRSPLSEIHKRVETIWERFKPRYDIITYAAMR